MLQVIGGLLFLIFIAALIAAIVGAVMAQRTKGSGPGSFWKKALGVAGLCFLGFIGVAAAIPDPAPTPDQVVAVVSDNAATATARDAADSTNNQQTLTLPAAEVQFIQTILDAQAAYEAAPNELKKTAVRIKRDRALRVISPTGNIKGWYGRISETGTTSEGKAIVSIKLPSQQIFVKTWNNALSDMGDHTLIPFESKLYNALADMQKNQWVMFSAALLKEGSLTEAGGITEPEFVANFSMIESAFVDENGKPVVVVDDMD